MKKLENLIEFVDYVVKGIVKNAEMVKVRQFEDEENNIIIEIMVDNDDMGQVIGKGGKTINSLRTLIQTSAYNKGLERIKINVDSLNK